MHTKNCKTRQTGFALKDVSMLWTQCGQLHVHVVEHEIESMHPLASTHHSSSPQSNGRVLTHGPSLIFCMFKAAPVHEFCTCTNLSHPWNPVNLGTNLVLL